jgi:hypothetical protein
VVQTPQSAAEAALTLPSGRPYGRALRTQQRARPPVEASSRSTPREAVLASGSRPPVE